MSVSNIGAASSSTPFNISVQSTYCTVILTQQQPAGAYTFTSATNNNIADLYFYNATGTLVASTNGKSINPSQGFSKVVIIGGTPGDVLSFALQTTYYGTAETAETTAGPVILSANPTSLPNVNSTTTVTGLNFASNVTATFTGTDNLTRNAKSVVYGSATSIIVTRPDSMPVTYSPYTLTVNNPGVTPPSGSTKNQISTTAGVVPVWVTSSGNLLTLYDSQSKTVSINLSATDADGGSSVTYSISAGALPTGLSLNTSTGAITGTVSSVVSDTTYNFTITATDSGGNTANQSFNIILKAQVVQTFSYTGSTQLVTIPAGLSFIKAKIWGAGGGEYNAGTNLNNSGGAGGYTETTFNVLSGETNLTVVVGGGVPGNGGGGYGGGGSAVNGGSGGGGASIVLSGNISTPFSNATTGLGVSSVAQSSITSLAGATQVIAVAGGGGGAGWYTINNQVGGNGGGLSGLNGSGASTTYAGTQSAAGTNGNQSAGAAKFQGAYITANQSQGGSGGGGGGWYGGATYQGTAGNNASGAGGSGFVGYANGSTSTVLTANQSDSVSYIDTTTRTNGTRTYTNSKCLASASGTFTPPNNSDTNYVAGVGVATYYPGNDGTSKNSGNGLVVLIY